MMALQRGLRRVPWGYLIGTLIGGWATTAYGFGQTVLYVAAIGFGCTVVAWRQELEDRR